MNISQVINSSIITKNIFSPNCKYLLVPKGSNIVLYSLNPSIKKLNKFSFPSTINISLFSPSSNYFLVLLSKLYEIQIKSVKNYEFNFRIQETIFGINSVIWSSDDYHILLSLNNYNNIHIYSTTYEYDNIEEEFDSAKNNNKYPKNFIASISNIKYQNLTQGISFSYGGEFLAIAIRKQIKDYIEIYYTKNFELVSSFVVNTTDLENIIWAKDNTYIITWENNHYDCKLYIYGLSGNLLSVNEPYKNYPGINIIKISPNGHYITAGYFDNSIRLYHYLSFKICKEINPSNLLFPDIFNKNSDFKFDKTVILVENNKSEEFKHLIEKEKYMFSIEKSYPKNIVINNNINNDLFCITNLDYSFNSKYLAFTSNKYQHILMIYDITSFKLSSLLVFDSNIVHFEWSPNCIQLIICTETKDKIYFFVPQKVKIFNLPNVNDKSNSNNESSILNYSTMSSISTKKGSSNKIDKKIFISSDGQKILLKISKYNFFLIEPGNDI